MPGRVSSSAPRATRRTAASRSAGAQAIEVPDEGENTSLRRAICSVFADAQKSTTGHRKAVISLRIMQENCCYEPASPKKKSLAEDFEEADFNREFVRCTLRVLPVKKSESAADRVVRFLGTFLSTASAKDNEIFEQYEEETARETPTARLTTMVLSTLLPVLQAKDKTVRFRATQIVSHLINSLDELDQSVFERLHLALVKRLHDKEAPVRLQAVYGLGRLAAETDGGEVNHDSDDEDDIDSSLLQKLRQVLINDPSGEVRRNVLLNFPITKDTLPWLLDRSRDVDTTTRRAVFARLLPELSDFRYMSMAYREKMLRDGLLDREDSVRKAAAKLFRERWIENLAALPAATAEDMQETEGNGEEQQPKPANQAAAPSRNALLELLQRIDVMKNGLDRIDRMDDIGRDHADKDFLEKDNSDEGIAQLAMREFWEGRPDYVEDMSFPDAFWDDLTAERAFLVRSYNDFCRTPSQSGQAHATARGLEEMAEEKLPEVTKFSYLLQRELQRLADSTAAVTDDEDEENIGECEERTFIVLQMLHMSLTFDYSDEIGRRRMLTLVREMLAVADLPDELTRLAINVLRLLCGDGASAEREFCGTVIEIIFDVRDNTKASAAGVAENSFVEESFHSATSQPDDENDDQANTSDGTTTPKRPATPPVPDPEKEAEAELEKMQRNLKCLHMAVCMLQNVTCDLHSIRQLEDLVDTVITPAARNKSLPIRERGFQCLALACLLGKKLAEDNIRVFINTFTIAKGFPRLQRICLHSVADTLITHPSLFISKSAADESAEEKQELMKNIIAAFSRALKSKHDSVQATGAIAVSKAMLHGLVTDLDLLKQLVTSYFEPDNVDRQNFQQAMSYFLPVYCHSRVENATRMVQVTCGIIHRVVTLREDFFDNADADTEIAGDGLVKLNTISQMLVDWTDPHKIVGFTKDDSSTSANPGISSTHLLLAESILERLVTTQVVKEESKTLLFMLGKLHLPTAGCEPDLVKSVLGLLAEAVETRVASDETSRKVLVKLQTTLLKTMHDIATAERGGGGPEETVVEGDTVADAFTLRPGMEEATEYTEAGAEEEAEQRRREEEVEDNDDGLGSTDEDAETQLQREIRESMLDATNTAGFGFTTGLPDAEGTRIQDLVEYETTVEDTDMMDVDG